MLLKIMWSNFSLLVMNSDKRVMNNKKKVTDFSIEKKKVLLQKHKTKF